MDLGHRVRDLRNAQHLSQIELAARAGVARNTLNRIENGHLMPTAPVIEHLAEALNVAPGVLFEEPVPLAEAPPLSGPHGKEAKPPASDTPEEEQAAEPLSPKLRQHVASMRRAELDRVLKHLTLRLETLRDQAKTHYEADATPKDLWPVFMDSVFLTRGAEALLAENREEAEELGGETAEERRLRDRLEHRIEDADEVRGAIGDMWRELLDAENEAENEALRKEARPKTEPADVDNVRNLFRREQAV